MCNLIFFLRFFYFYLLLSTPQVLKTHSGSAQWAKIRKKCNLEIRSTAVCLHSAGSFEAAQFKFFQKMLFLGFFEVHNRKNTFPKNFSPLCNVNIDWQLFKVKTVFPARTMTMYFKKYISFNSYFLNLLHYQIDQLLFSYSHEKVSLECTMS